MASVVQSSLPPIDAVDIVDLAGIGFRVDHVSDYMAAAANAPHVHVHGAAAARIADLWRTLEPAEQARCHVPPFGLRFYAGGKLVCEASICWRCNNLYGQADGREVFLEFDGSAPGARMLLATCEQALGRPAAE